MDSCTEEIHVILDTLRNTDPEVTHSALRMLVQKLRSSTSVASTIPKILMYLISQKDILREILDTLHGSNREIMADILSVISAASEDLDSLRYRIQGGSTSLDIWGHQYIKKLTNDIIRCYRSESTITKQELLKVLSEVIPCLFKFNSECDAIDLLIEVDLLHLLPEYIDRDNVDRGTSYLTGLLPYLEKTVRSKSNCALIEIYREQERPCDYTPLMIEEMQMDELQVALREEPHHVALQMAYILAKYSVWFRVSNEQIQSILNNEHIHVLNRYVAEKLELLQEKDRSIGSFPEALTKASFFSEKISEKESKKNFKISSLGSIGFFYLWDPKACLDAIGDQLFSDDGVDRVTSILALSVSGCNVHDENDTLLAAAREALSTNSTTQRLSVIEALSIQFADTCRADLFELLREYTRNDQKEVSYFSVYAIGSIYVGSKNADLFTELLSALMEQVEPSPFIKYALLGISLIFLGAGDKVLPLLDAAESLEIYGKSLSILMRGLAYFGTGNTKVLHDLLKEALEESSPSLEEEDHEEHEELSQEYKQIFAILGISFISAGEETLTQMATHILEGSMLLDMPKIQMAVPLALSILHISTGKTEIIDTLQRCAHSGDHEVIVAAISALGIVAAGTKNSRVNSALEQMATFCGGKGGPALSLKVSQGLLHLGKGMLKLSIFSGGVPSLKGISGILGFIFSLMDGGAQVLDRYYFLLLLLAPGISPKYLVTVNEEGVPVDASIRVGTRIDVSGVAGRPKRISGAQTHEGPVLLQAPEGAEVLGHAPSYHTSEGVVVVPHRVIQ
ncbi:26S proteasome regulatory subunit N1 [Nematocida sp. LUAm3]|nr:26S proteasome regulatory subunit N1 [Nematocida sp. LUAm3]KAI5173662.1 26S proteasome regulatory subunit N1 [Nematocida sp. LUAm2]KAI5176883.1 26S proteasome regulatory subunit N1 [Nematocida sp. LUAm1]